MDFTTHWIEPRQYTKNSARQMENRFKDGSEKVSPTRWKSFVHVTDPHRFCKHLKFKHRESIKEWKKKGIDVP